ncbi:MAG TPA: hypothetical protein VGG64_17815 [Pirellulales bacterium]
MIQVNDWQEFKFKHDMGEPFGLRIHRRRKIGIGYVEDLKFKIADNRIVDGDLLLSREEFRQLADAWREVTGEELRGNKAQRILGPLL